MLPKKIQSFREPDPYPSPDRIAKELGEAFITYSRFLDELETRDIQLEWRYCNDGKAWLAKGLHRWTGARGGQKEKTLFWLSIWKLFFRVTVYIPDKGHGDLLNAPLDGKARAIVSSAKQMGKISSFPIVFDVYSDEVLDALLAVTDFRKRIQ
jgi:hypothetical protein